MLSEFFPGFAIIVIVVLSTDRESIRFVVWHYIYLCYRSEAFLGEFLKDISGDQFIARGLFGMAFTFDDIFSLVIPDFLLW